MAKPGKGGAERGARFERQIAAWLLDHWGLLAQRVRSGRVIDEGDLVWPGGERFHVDCKSRGQLKVLSWWLEVEAEADQAGRIPVMIVDLEGVGDKGRSMVVMRLQDCSDLLA